MNTSKTGWIALGNTRSGAPEDEKFVPELPDGIEDAFDQEAAKLGMVEGEHTGPLSETETETETEKETEKEEKPVEDADAGSEGEKDQEEEDKSEDKAGDKPEGKSEDKPEGKTEEKVEDNSEKKEEKPADARDNDLDIKLNPNVAPKTREVIETFKTKAQEARTERDVLKKELDEARAKLKEGGMDETTKKELEELRREVRNINIEKDPGLRLRYDQRVAENESRIVGMLKKHGMPEASIEALKKSGLKMANLDETLKILNKAGYAEDEDEIREMLRENTKISREKQAEIEKIKTDYTSYQERQTAEEKRQAAEVSDRIRVEFDKNLKAIGAEYPEFKCPPMPEENDTDAVKKVKLASVEQYKKTFGEYIVKVNKLAEDGVQTFQTAAKGLAYMDYIVPSMKKQITDLKAKLAEAEGQLGRVKKAGSMTKLVGSSKPSAQDRKTPQASSVEDLDSAFDEAAKNMGMR